jgi:hypothetical protein
MLRDLKSSISKLPPQKARSDVELMPRQPATPAFGDLALGQLQKAKEFIRPDPPLFSNGIVMRKVEDEDKYHCTFCAYECDFGISDARTWLGADASKGFCKLCLKDGMGFYEDWSISTLSRKVNEDRLEQLDKMCNWPVLGERRRDVVREKEKEKDKGEMVDIEASAPAPRKKRVTSAIDGLDTTHYQGVQFCAGCPWRQVDVMKARICEECKLEKFLIIKHRHQKFLPLVDARPWKKGEPLYWGEKKREVKERNCMVCPRLAMYRCEACPLRLCGDCQAYLELMCKGWLDNLLYLYRNEHIRNDVSTDLELFLGEG